MIVITSFVGILILAVNCNLMLSAFEYFIVLALYKFFFYVIFISVA